MDLVLLLRSSTLSLLLILLCNSLSFSLHGSWMDHYKGKFNLPCCGPRDCLKVSSRILEYKETTIVVEVNGVRFELDKGIVHISEDEYDWMCSLYEGSILCLFISIGT